MGEKIRDLSSIRIGSDELTIELNAGYTKNEGKLIHIQNKHFRYLLKEMDFLELATTIMRAHTEMKYYKEKKVSQSTNMILTCGDLSGDKEEEVSDYICHLFQINEIEYRLIELRPHIVSFIVANNKYEEFKTVLERDKMLIKKEHLYSEKFGYSYLYQMRPFELFAMDDTYVEFYFQLPCRSLTDKTWIPLHSLVQTRVWQQNEENEKGQYILDGLDYGIYRLCWAIYNRGVFNEYDISIIKKSEADLNSDQGKEILAEIFFNFTDELLSCIKNDEFELIIPKYYAFKDY